MPRAVSSVSRKLGDPNVKAQSRSYSMTAGPPGNHVCTRAFVREVPAPTDGRAERHAQVMDVKAVTCPGTVWSLHTERVPVEVLGGEADPEHPDAVHSPGALADVPSGAAVGVR